MHDNNKYDGELKEQLDMDPTVNLDHLARNCQKPESNF